MCSRLVFSTRVPQLFGVFRAGSTKQMGYSSDWYQSTRAARAKQGAAAQLGFKMSTSFCHCNATEESVL